MNQTPNPKSYASIKENVEHHHESHEQPLLNNGCSLRPQTHNGEWVDPVNLGVNVNSEASENRPYLTPDEKYLFFTSTRNESLDIFWVDTKIIWELMSNKK